MVDLSAARFASSPTPSKADNVLWDPSIPDHRETMRAKPHGMEKVKGSIP